MNDADDNATDVRGALDRRWLFEEVTARLIAVTSSLADFNMDTAQLHTTTQELGAVVRRIEWLADTNGPTRLNARDGRQLVVPLASGSPL